MLHEKTSWPSKVLLAAGLVVYLLIVAKPLATEDQLDLFVYRMGAQLALRGESPYDSTRLQSEVIKAFPPQDDDAFALNCGFFLPPQAIVLFAPFAPLDWQTAQNAWFAILTLFGIGCGSLARTFGRDPTQRGAGGAIIILAVLLNPITQLSLVVGQTGLFFVGCIALGQYCFENGWPRLGCFLWALTFFKPHLALPFLALAAVLGGWKRVAGIVLGVALLNLLGGLLTRGTMAGAVHLFREYLDYVGNAHKTVLYNLVEFNPQITSWNRILVAVGGPALDLRITMILGGFVLWAALIAVRLRFDMPRRDVFDRPKLDQAYLLAATAVGALFFAQVLASEMILLILLAPLILQHFDANRRGDAWAIIGMLLFLLIPRGLMDQFADGLHLSEEARGRNLLRSHKCFGMAVVALYLLIRGPLNHAPYRVTGP